MIDHFRLAYHFRFVGSARLSELQHSDTAGNHRIVKDAISRKIGDQSSLMIVEDKSIEVEIQFLPAEYYYIILIHMKSPKKAGNDREYLEARIEGLIAEALLEFFGDGLSSF